MRQGIGAAVSVDRDHLIELLERLGDADDGSVLGAAREAHAAVAGAGRSWAEVIAVAEVAGEAGGDQDAEEEEALPVAGRDAGEALEIIARLLARSDLSQETREELLGYKRDIEAGELDDAERSYLRALDRRLSQ